MLTLALALAMPAPAHARDLDRYQPLHRMHHTAYTAKDGLLGAALALAQTTDGYLWIGTSNGLYRFDGLVFERYQPPAGTLPATSVTSLLAVADGGLWVGYTRGGATFISPDGPIANYTVDSGLPIGTIRSFAQAPDGVVWVAATGGLARLVGGRWQPVRMDWNYPCRSAWRLFVDRQGTLWVGGASPDKLLYLPKDAQRFRDAGLDSYAIGIAQVGDDTIAVGDWPASVIHEIRRHADGSTTRRTIAKLPTLGVASDRDGGLWIAGQDIVRLRVAGNAGDAAGREGDAAIERVTADDGLSGRTSRAFLEDREGNMWVATEGGLDRFRRRNLTWRSDAALRNGGSLVADAKGQVWALTWGVPSLRRADDGVIVPDAPRQLHTGFSDPDGSVWIVRDNQLLRWTEGRFTPVPPPDEVVARGYQFGVLAAAVDRSGRLWASVIGIGQFYRKDDRWTFVPVLEDRPDWTATRAHADAADRVWLTYRDELAMVDQGKVRLFTKADGLDVGPLLSLGSRDREVWVGGESGLAFLQGGRFHVVRTASATDFGAVADIVGTGNGLWVSAATGIAHIPDAEIRRLLADPGHRARHELFDLVSDLPESLKVRTRSITAVEAGGVLWFLTNGGVARVDPRQIVRNAVPPPVSIRAVTADDTPYSPRGAVSLPPLTRTLRIDYTALSLSIPERVRFRYRLEGWETDWHEAGTRRTVFYTDLKPGQYAFRVLACNNDGVWNDTGATLAFTVAPAWYQTAWFQALVVIALAALVATLYRIRMRRVSAALSARFDERLAERTRIARDLHDTLLQTVQGSRMVADDALDRLEDPEYTRRAVERLSEWLGRAVQEGRAALNSLRASTEDVNDLAESFRRAADDPTKPPALAVSVDVRGEARDLHPIVRDEIYRIGYEAIRNAYAHSKGTRLEIALEYAHDLTLRITDNGVGIGPVVAGSGKRGRFGLPGMRERAANIGGALSVVSTSSGTSISLVVPGRSVFRRGSASHAPDRRTSDL